MKKALLILACLVLVGCGECKKEEVFFFVETEYKGFAHRIKRWVVADVLEKCDNMWFVKYHGDRGKRWVDVADVTWKKKECK